MQELSAKRIYFGWKKAHMPHLYIKIMFVYFFDHKEIVYAKFLDKPFISMLIRKRGKNY